MNWISLRTENEIEALAAESKEHPVLVFKHSTRCSISATALARLTRKWQDVDDAKVKPYYLDLIANRPASNYVASFFGVRHESPQALVIKDGKVVYTASHMDISYEDILASPATV